MKQLKLCYWKKIDFTVRNIADIKCLDSCVLGKTLNTLNILNQREEINAFVNKEININERKSTILSKNVCKTVFAYKRARSASKRL